MNRILTAALVLAVAVAVAWGYGERYNRLRMVNALEASYQQNFYRLLSDVEQTEVSLAKALASGSPRHGILYLTEVWNRASAAQAAVSQLPFPEVNLAASRKFLAQLGDYSHNLAQLSAGGRPLGPDQLNELSRFHTEVGRFSRELHRLEEQMVRGGFRWADAWGGRPGGAARAVAADGRGLADGFVNLDKRLQELPSLVYDGPFSDHLELVRPRGLTGRQLTAAEARQRARDLLDGVDGRTLTLSGQQETAGRIPAFRYTFRDGRGTVTVDVSQQGGHLVWLLNDRRVGQARLNAAEALQKAAAYLARAGFPEMQATYTMRQDNMQVISFAAREGDVLLYPDLVKVRVALDDGAVLGVEALGYLMAHHRRNLPPPKVSAEEVRRMVNPALAVRQVRPVVIPMESGREVLAWEVRAEREQEKFLLYYNALTGDEEQILKLIDVPGGELAM